MGHGKKQQHKPNNRQPHPVDIHVGKRLRERRQNLDIGQKMLARRVGNIAYQQLQKYETAGNRISVSRLYEFSKALDVPVKYFFEGYTDETREDGMPDTGQQPFDNEDPFAGRETLKLVRTYYDIADPALRKAFLDMIRALGRSNTE